MRESNNPPSANNREYYRIICENAMEGIIVAVVETRKILFANQAACRMFGYEPREMISLSVEDIHPSREHDRVIGEFKAMAEGRKHLAPSLPCVKKDGTAFLADIRSTPVVIDGVSCNAGFFTDVSERKYTQDEILESEKRYRALVETTGTGYVIIDQMGVVADANQEYVRLTGRKSVDEIIGNSVITWTAPYEHEKNRAAVESCVRDGSIRDFEVDYCTPGGDIVPIELNATVVEIHGKPMILTLCRDISRRRATERRLKDREELFRKVFEDSPYGMIFADKEHRIVNPNAAFCRMIGFGKTELIGRHFSEFIHPEERPLVSKNVSLQDLGRFHINKIETRYLKKDGRVLWTCVSVYSLNDGSGNFRTNLAIVEDISDRKMAETALASSEALFRRLIESAPEAIYIQAREKITFVNSAACALFGAASPGEILGADLLERIHPDFREAIRARVRRINEERKENALLEQVYLRLDGTAVPVEVSAVPIEFQGQNGALVFVRDITERKKNEEILRNAQKLESIGVLAGGIAHDFNNLLTGMFGNLDLLRMFLQEGDTAEAFATLARAMHVFERARSLTTQLLTFSKGGSPQRRPVDLETLLRDTVKFALSGSSVGIDLDFGKNLWQGNVDPNQIGQVVENIVINAVQAMPGGGVLTVRAENVMVASGDNALLKAGPFVKVCFTDTGVGIPATIIRRIFDPFFSTKQQGSGLGLATAYSIIKRHDGIIEVDSVPEKGSTFSIFLPAAPGAAESRAPDDSGVFKGTGTVLVMDDEQFILEVASKMLSRMGFTPLPAASGEEAVMKLDKAVKAGGHVAAAILDLTVPGGMGGKDAAPRLKALDPGIVIVVSSGYSDDPVMADPEKYGFAGSLKKPYEVREMRRILRTVLGNG